MNCVELFTQHARLTPGKTALWISPQEQVSFGELAEQAGQVQNLLKQYGLQEGDSILLLEPLTTTLYAYVCAALASGITVILVEPWLPLKDIHHIVELVKPKVFCTRWWGYLWGARVKSVRNIPHWHLTKTLPSSSRMLEIHEVKRDTPGIITFTSGTTGRPKGVLRTQQYLIDQFQELDQALHLTQNSGPDLTLFANFALANLAAGKTSVIVHPQWKEKQLLQIQKLPPALQPVTTTMGPGFLKHILDLPHFASHLQSIHVGGALTDTWLFKEAFAKWPNAHFTHIYGSSEAEPVAFIDAKIAVESSESAGYFQTLLLGQPSPHIEVQETASSLWVSGPHVCPEYVGNPEETKKNKRRDDQGNIWHDMGDRVQKNDGLLWYVGRSFQQIQDFETEQKIYSYLQSSSCFIHRSNTGEKILIGQNIISHEIPLKEMFAIDHVKECAVQRDRRHRARLDRVAMLKKSGVSA